MATFGWSYTKNFSGSKRPRQESRKVEEWQTNRVVNRQALHPQSHSAETVTAGKKFRYDHRARLYVGNLSTDTNEVILAQHFSTFGELIGAKIIKDHESGFSRGFGFVTFDCVQDAEAAKKWFAYNHLKINGREITVRNAERRNPSKGKEAAEKKNIVRDVRRGMTLYWEYKWTKDNSAQVYGPYETNLMLQWSKSGYFDSGCWVRQVDPQALVGGGGEESVDDPQAIIGGGEAEDSTDATQSKKPKLMLDYSDSSSDSENDTACVQLANGRGGGEDDDDDGDDDGNDSNDNTQSTEFVHVSEIDFSFFP